MPANITEMLILCETFANLVVGRCSALLRARVLFHFQFIFISSSSNLRVNAPSYSLGFEVTFIGSRYFASTFDRLNFDRLNKEKL